jgi:hypothetical protein
MNIVSSRHADPGMPAHARIVMVTVSREQGAAVRCGTHVLQRMRAIPIDPPAASAMLAAPPVPPARLLPRMRAADTEAGGLASSRTVRGEILCDEAGRFYEKIGHVVRPLHHLASGPRGTVIDVAREADEAPPGWPAEDDAREVGTAPAQPCRALYPAFGRRTLVAFGDFKALLSAQLARPERLRDTHRLACRLQVYEVLCATTADAIREATGGGLSLGEELYLLTPAGARCLGMPHLLAPGAPSDGADRAPGRLVRGDYVFQLTVDGDPTKDAPASARPAPSHEPRAPERKRAIPERYLSPWAFSVSREQALYEMSSGRWPRLRALASRLAHPFAARAQERRWCALVAGKTPDDQLWSVPPPTACRTAAFRERIRQLLDAAGYDPAVMLAEWEIFWRRKRQ